MSNNQPSHIGYIVAEPERRGQRAVWHRVATVWPHSKGNGFDLVIPPGVTISGRIVCTERKEKPAEDAA